MLKNNAFSAAGLSADGTPRFPWRRSRRGATPRVRLERDAPRGPDTKLAVKLSLALALLAGSSGPARGDVYTVGPTPDCTHAQLLLALLSAALHPGADEIHLIAGSTHVGPFPVQRHPVTIAGGYQSCSSTAVVGRSTLTAPAGQRVLDIEAAPTSVSIRLKELLIEKASFPGDGGAVFIEGSTEVVFDNVVIMRNSATGKGGGIFIDATLGVEVTLVNSGINFNVAESGGGLACESASPSPAALVTLTGATSVDGNEATADGGGLYIGRGCRLNAELPGISAPIRNNTAGSRGGGVFLSEGYAEVSGTASAQGLLTGNSATLGGGVFVDREGTFWGRNLAVTFNTATLRGGGAAVFGGGIFWLSRPNGSPCPELDHRCVELFGNQALDGAAVYTFDFYSDAILSSVHVRNNSATVGAVAAAENGGRIFLASSLVAGNSGVELLSADGDRSELHLVQSTMGGNTVADGLLGIGGDIDFLEINGDLFWGENQPLFSRYTDPNPPSLSCLFSSEAVVLTALPPGTGEAVLAVGDPELVNAQAGDFHLLPTSPAIDLCPLNRVSMLVSRDIDGEAYDQDDPGHIGPDGAVRDIGADEYQPPLFADGFENGDLSAWSLVTE